VNGVLTQAVATTLISSLTVQEKNLFAKILSIRIKSLEILLMIFLLGLQTQLSMTFISEKMKE